MRSKNIFFQFHATDMWSYKSPNMKTLNITSKNLLDLKKKNCAIILIITKQFICCRVNFIVAK